LSRSNKVAGKSKEKLKNLKLILWLISDRGNLSIVAGAIGPHGL